MPESQERLRVSLRSDAHNAADTREAVEQAVKSFLAAEGIRASDLRAEGSFNPDATWVQIVVSFAVSVAANELHSPKWIPALRQFLRERFGDDVNVEDE